MKASIWTSSLVFEVPKIESFYCNVDSGQYQILSNIVIFAVIHDIRHSIEYWIAVTISSGFYFEKKMHAELLWWRKQHALQFDKDNFVSKKNVSSPVWQYFRFKAGENGKLSHDNVIDRNIWAGQYYDIKF